jgi:hypothetical protein
LNTLGGGDVATPAFFMMNLNPAVIEHLFDGYFGGVSMITSQAVKTALMPFGKQDVETRSMPIVSRFVVQSNENTASGRYAKKYFEIKDELNAVESRIRLYDKSDTNDELSDRELKSYDDLSNSNEINQIEELKSYEKTIRDLNDDVKLEKDEEAIKDLKKQISDARKEFVEWYLDDSGKKEDNIQKITKPAIDLSNKTIIEMINEWKK